MYDMSLIHFIYLCLGFYLLYNNLTKDKLL